MAKDKKKDDESAASKKKEPPKNNLLIIGGLVGCGGLLLVACIAAGGIGVWLYSKSGSPKDGVAQTKDKDGKTDPPKDGKTTSGSYLKKDYDRIRMGHPKGGVETMRGGQGNIGKQW